MSGSSNTSGSSTARNQLAGVPVAERQQPIREGLVTMQYPMLSKDNYASWSIKIQMFMEAQGLWDVVENAAVAATDPRRDKMALAPIYQCIPEDTLLAIAEKKTAKDAWLTLKTMHLGAERVKNARVQTLRTEFELLRMKDGESLDEFAMKLTSLVNRIRGLGQAIEEVHVVKKLLRAVSKRFLPIVSTIEQFGDIDKMPLDEAIGRLKAHEKRVRAADDVEGEKLMLSHSEWVSRTKQNVSDKSSNPRWRVSVEKSGSAEKSGRGRPHWRERGRGRGRSNWQNVPRQDGESSQGARRDKSKVRCFNCNLHGHFASECRHRKRNEEVNVSRAEDDEPALMMALTDEQVMLSEENVVPELRS
ncbi:unnamed protein product [Rhodiola kirilowii]